MIDVAKFHYTFRSKSVCVYIYIDFDKHVNKNMSLQKS